MHLEKPPIGRLLVPFECYYENNGGSLNYIAFIGNTLSLSLWPTDGNNKYLVGEQASKKAKQTMRLS